MTEMGRPTVMTEAVLQKLVEAFSNAFSDKEACLYAGISPSTLYNYCVQNPDFSERKEQLKLSLNMHAKNNIAKAIKAGDVNRSVWWATTKIADEFAPKTKMEHSGSVETPVPTQQLQSAAADAIRERFETELRSTIVKPSKSPENGQNGENSPIVVEVGARPESVQTGPIALAGENTSA